LIYVVGVGFGYVKAGKDFTEHEALLVYYVEELGAGVDCFEGGDGDEEFADGYFSFCESAFCFGY